jgi:hypothetical protein
MDTGGIHCPCVLVSNWETETLLAIWWTVYVNIMVRDPVLFPLMTELDVVAYNKLSTLFYISDLCPGNFVIEARQSL